MSAPESKFSVEAKRAGKIGSRPFTPTTRFFTSFSLERGGGDIFFPPKRGDRVRRYIRKSSDQRPLYKYCARELLDFH